ncbi:MAG: bifunctional alpha/beta hydrolase/OsmC family protein [Xanthobacteraceae bacterium]|nr:bifunctional alpha/beta hydrolase/OsmC family protein [Xanthobacteraceae bacterium]
MLTERFQFPGADGQMLSAALDLPENQPSAFALLAHCFTCGKDVLAAKRIADGLVARGIAVLRFDFTGLGSSEGEFANTHFSSNVADLVCAANHLRQNHQAPALLIGHSLGGAAVLAAAAQVPEAKAVVTIAAPSDPAHVVGLFKDHVERIQQDGEAEVSLAGRPFTIRREFLEDVSTHRLKDHIHTLHKALLIFHSPTDDTVSIDNATEIFLAARHPKSFVSLSGANHLLSDRRDALYVADMIATWSMRYLDMTPAAEPAPHDTDVVVQETGASRFQQKITAGSHTFLADEPASVGGMDSGPGPYDFLLAGLGACTSMTMRLYAERKALPLERTTVRLRHSRVYAKDCEECETKEGMISRIDREISMEGDLSEEQRAKLMEIADKCPVHRTLTSDIQIVTRAT